MSHLFFARLFAVCVLSIVSGTAFGAGHVVNVGQNGGLTFSPQTLTIDPGDSVTFINKGGFHNAVADDGSFRCARGCDGDGNGGNGAASNTLWIASLTFNKPGRIGYFCEVHGAPGEGMFGTIIVTGTVAAPTTRPAPASTPFFLALLAVAILIGAAWALRRIRASSSRS
jgi:plastocyanin